jgi:serine/threonine-protein kinase
VPDADVPEAEAGGGSGCSTFKAFVPPEPGGSSPPATEGRPPQERPSTGDDRQAPLENRQRGDRQSREEDREPVRRSAPTESELLRSKISRFVKEWKRGREPRIVDYLAGAGPHRTTLLLELLEKDLEHRLEAGLAHEVELYLEDYPELEDEQAANLIVRDYELRRRRGIRVTEKEYLNRFPRLKPMLEGRFGSIKASHSGVNRTPTAPWSQAPAATSFSAVGSRSPFETKFEMIEKLGEGGMGEVWRVRHRDLDEIRAVKFILPRQAHNDESRERLRREAQAMARVNHPHAVTVYDVSMDDIPYIEMEYVRGRPLNKILTPKVPLPLKQTAQILEQLCDVLQNAHDHRIIHRDLKPSNMMLIEGGPAESIYLKVLDFGLAKFLDPAWELTAPGLTLGTPVYMSPEQLEESSKVDARSDIYSVGVILYELLTGCRPFASTGVALLYDIGHTAASSFKVRNPDAQVAPALEKLVLRCLEKDPQRRPGSARELAEEFLRLAKPELGIRAETVTDQPRIGRRLILAGIAGLGLGALGLYRLVRHSPSSNGRPEPVTLAFSFVPGELNLQAGKSDSIFIVVPPDQRDAVIQVGDGLPQEVQVEPRESTSGSQRRFSITIDPNTAPHSRSLEFVVSDGRRTQRLSVPLVIQPPSIAPLPPNWERARPPEGPDLVKVNERIYPRFIQRVVSQVKDPVIAHLIEKPPDQPDQPDTFYIMRDKVWVGLFKAFADERPKMVQGSQWNKDADPRFPVLGVTGLEAQKFAEWLGGPRQGYLPTREQWDQAAGMNREPRRRGPYQESANPKDWTGIAVGRVTPRPVDDPSTRDISPYGCRDMSGNGCEWTRPTQVATKTSLVELRAETFKSLQPFRFETIEKDRVSSEAFGVSEEEIGFRVVIQLEPMPSA